ncbi:hypothetical protein DM292_17610 [Stutzerimonas frequens]|uniref:antibiotic biosynthesis monooxygenase n=1 Tax=Stutzerimonas frequens TaxID=2968969 RepID=UPI000D7E5B1E|nr:antibiotic biosynthesis monooxygenase [Stutzerimonas frequens]AWT11885.1 hypothetical protein DM292_17610 [Stutzerimonas frequens]
MNDSSQHAVLLLVSRRIKPQHEAQFEQLMAEFISAVEAFPGCLGARLVHPGEEGMDEDALYHALIAFKDQGCLKAWQASPERAAGLASISPHVEGPLAERGVSGLGHWFRPRTAMTPQQPPRWKIAVMTCLGIFPTVYLLFLLLGDILASLPLLPRTLLFTMLVVVIMTWGVAPQLSRLLRPWLYALKRPGSEGTAPKR